MDWISNAECSESSFLLILPRRTFFLPSSLGYGDVSHQPENNQISLTNSLHLQVTLIIQLENLKFSANLMGFQVST